jgi:hypothetical protein
MLATLRVKIKRRMSKLFRKWHAVNVNNYFMKPKKQSIKSQEIPISNITPAIASAEAKAEFIRRINKRPGDGNNNVDSFLCAMDAIKATKRSFTADDVHYYCSPYAIPRDELKPLWDKWLETMLSIHKVSVIEGCYDIPVVCWH